MKHGLLSQAVLLPDDNEDELLRLRKRYREELRPSGELEELLTEKIITAAWRLRRVLTVEVDVFQVERHDIFGAEKSVGYAFGQAARGGDQFVKLSRYEVALERSLYRALEELRSLQHRRGAVPVSTEREPTPADASLETEVADK
jgi:hypothetical protein